ncbi:HAD family hydrolase [bacterium]|nr:sulfotransferase [Planktomarina temperata]MDC1036072.1 HAD family hydrolase [bacterium]MDC1263164.1 sulfotransferase [Planktomarina temperata]
MKIAMWSGPRNLSTAMMYAFGNRADTQIVDEPFYGAYLHHSNADHPMRAEIMASMACDPAQVSAELSGPVPGGAAIWYQKHMTHHMLDHFPMDLLVNQRNVFLIRDPARVIASYARKRADVTLYDLGFVQQKKIFDHCVALGQVPIVIDSDDILADPKSTLMELCLRLEIAFDPAMLHWPAGPRAQDGIWAAHWYDAVHRSTGFGPAPGPAPRVDADYDALWHQAQAIYEQLQAAK